MTKIILTEMNDDFKCECGNISTHDGFYPCDKKGSDIEPNPSWEGHYKCASCDQIYLYDSEHSKL